MLEPGVGPKQERTLIKTIKNAVGSKLVKRMNKAISQLKTANEPTTEKAKADLARGLTNGWSYHLGSWTPQAGKRIRACAENFSLKGIGKFFKAMASKHGLRQKVEGLTRRHFKLMAQRYNEVVDGDPDRITDVFRTMAVNIDGESKPHIDMNDKRDGLCLVMPFGEFSGGDLIFYELGLRFRLCPGDAIYFRSRILLHGNSPVESAKFSRHSLTFFTHEGDFYRREI